MRGKFNNNKLLLQSFAEKSYKNMFHKMSICLFWHLYGVNKKENVRVYLALTFKNLIIT